MCLSWVTLLRIYFCRVHYLIVLFSICFLSFRQGWKLSSRDGGGNRNRDFWKLLDVKIFVMFFSFSSISTFFSQFLFFFSLFLGNVIFMIAILFFFIRALCFYLLPRLYHFIDPIFRKHTQCRSYTFVYQSTHHRFLLIFSSLPQRLWFPNAIFCYRLFFTWSFIAILTIPKIGLFYFYLFISSWILAKYFSDLRRFKTKRSLINLYYKIFSD